MGLASAGNGVSQGKLCLSAFGYWYPVHWNSYYLSEGGEFEVGSGAFVCRKKGKYSIAACITGYRP